MKLLLLVFIAAMTMTITTNAQHANLGIKGGLNITNIHNSSSEKFDAVTGFNVGLLAHIHLDRHFALQPEIVYSTGGASDKNGPFATRYSMGYINVPVLFQYMFDNGFRLQAGPQVGFLVNAKAKTGNFKEDFKKDLNTVDFGLAAGMSYLVPTTGFGFDARYNLGLSNINKDGDVKSANRGFQVGVFYLFNKH